MAERRFAIPHPRFSINCAAGRASRFNAARNPALFSIPSTRFTIASLNTSW